MLTIRVISGYSGHSGVIPSYASAYSLSLATARGPDSFGHRSKSSDCISGVFAYLVRKGCGVTLVLGWYIFGTCTYIPSTGYLTCRSARPTPSSLLQGLPRRLTGRAPRFGPILRCAYEELRFKVPQCIEIGSIFETKFAAEKLKSAMH